MEPCPLPDIYVRPYLFVASRNGRIDTTNHKGSPPPRALPQTLGETFFDMMRLIRKSDNRCCHINCYICIHNSK